MCPHATFPASSVCAEIGRDAAASASADSDMVSRVAGREGVISRWCRRCVGSSHVNAGRMARSGLRSWTPTSVRTSTSAEAAQRGLRTNTTPPMQHCPCAWVLPHGRCAHYQEALVGVDLPEWWGARHARPMYNATTSTLAPHADPRGGFTVLDQEQRRLHNHAHALGFSPTLAAICERAVASRPVPRSWPGSLLPRPRWAACSTRQALPHHPAG